MSVANTLTTCEAAYIVTDGGFTDLATGKLTEIEDKVIELPRLNAAMTALGGAWIAPYLAMDIEQQDYGTYEELVDGVRKRLPTTVREVFEQVSGAPENWGEFAVVFAGWDDGGKADVLYVNDEPGQPFQVSRTPGAAFKAIPCAVALDADNIETSAVEMADAQRIVSTSGESVPFTGFVQLTTIDARGIRKKTLKTYPDEVGKRAKAQ